MLLQQSLKRPMVSLTRNRYHSLFTMTTAPKIAFVGFGNILKPVLIDLLKMGYAPENFILSSPSLNKQESYSVEIDDKVYNIPTARNNQSAIEKADIVYLGIKPYQVEALGTLSFSPKTIIISPLAGVPIDVLQQLTRHDNICRTMPNVARAGGGHTLSAAISNDDRKKLTPFLQACCCTVSLAEEGLIDSVTATSGSGIAYFFLLFECLFNAFSKLNRPFSMEEIKNSAIVELFTEAMIDGAISLNLSPHDARQLVNETKEGAFTLVALKSKETPETPLLELLIHLRQSVTSNKGTTDKAIKYFIAHDLAQLIEDLLYGEKSTDTLKQLVVGAMYAAFNRAGEIAKESRKATLSLRPR